MLHLLVMIGAIFLAQPCFAASESDTARGVFALLPPSIFENTPEGLTDADKQDLLNGGISEYWEIAGETDDVLVFDELPFRDRAVALRIFHNVQDHSKDVAIGTLGEQICSVELWRIDASGRITPVETPTEPSYGEFFRRRPPRGYGQSVLICLGMGGLSAKPMLWDKNGVTQPKADFEITFVWDGAKFVKQVRPVQSEKR